MCQLTDYSGLAVVTLPVETYEDRFDCHKPLERVELRIHNTRHIQAVLGGHVFEKVAHVCF